MAREKFERKKPHVNIDKIGPLDHDKTALTAKITTFSARQGMAKARNYSQIDETPEEKARGTTISTSHLVYGSEPRRCRLYLSHLDPAKPEQAELANLVNDKLKSDLDPAIPNTPKNAESEITVTDKRATMFAQTSSPSDQEESKETLYPLVRPR